MPSNFLGRWWTTIANADPPVWDVRLQLGRPPKLQLPMWWACLHPPPRHGGTAKLGPQRPMKQEVDSWKTLKVHRKSTELIFLLQFALVTLLCPLSPLEHVSTKNPLLPTPSNLWMSPRLSCRTWPQYSPETFIAFRKRCSWPSSSTRFSDESCIVDRPIDTLKTSRKSWSRPILFQLPKHQSIPNPNIPAVNPESLKVKVIQQCCISAVISFIFCTSTVYNLEHVGSLKVSDLISADRQVSKVPRCSKSKFPKVPNIESFSKWAFWSQRRRFYSEDFQAKRFVCNEGPTWVPNRSKCIGSTNEKGSEPKPTTRRQESGVFETNPSQIRAPRIFRIVNFVSCNCLYTRERERVCNCITWTVSPSEVLWSASRWCKVDPHFEGLTQKSSLQLFEDNIKIAPETDSRGLW